MDDRSFDVLDIWVAISGVFQVNGPSDPKCLSITYSSHMLIFSTLSEMVSRTERCFATLPHVEASLLAVDSERCVVDGDFRGVGLLMGVSLMGVS